MQYITVFIYVLYDTWGFQGLCTAYAVRPLSSEKFW